MAVQRARRLGAGSGSGAHLPPLRRQRRDLPRELGYGIDLALRPAPRERGSVEELRGTLVAALAQVGDQPGVVSSPWRRTNDLPSSHELGGERLARGDPEHPQSEPRPSLRAPGLAALAWPPRGLAAFAAGALTLWFTGHVLVAAPLPPALSALLAAALVMALPRAGWLVLVASLASTAALGGRSGAALVLVTGALLPVFLLPFAPSAWPLCAGAPALGMLGLAGAWPAVAARVASAPRRAGLGLIGWVWLELAGPLAGQSTGLYAGRAPRTPPSGVWAPSLGQAVHHVLLPLLSSGALAPAPVWALGALVLPWLVRGRSLALDAVLAAAWAGAVVSATIVVLGGVHSGGGVHEIHGMGPALGAWFGPAAGAALSALVALAPSTLRRWRAARRRRSARAGLA